MSFIRTVAFLSNHLGIEVEDDEYTADNFGTFRAIGDFIEAKEASARYHAA
jgi:acyl carrier protein